PMLKRLEQLGVPDEIVDALNSRLKPIVDAGYSRLTPDAGPHFSHGQLVGLPAPLAPPKDLPAPARVRNGVFSAVDSTRNIDSGRVMDPATREATPNPTNPDRRADGGPRGALRQVFDGVKERLTSLALRRAPA
ncbi:MAG: PE-PPE domain-containing protein, partial [Mycobacterium sp.]